ncbi:MAG: NADH-quinone oxidoreductase subunit C [bacterium]|uniref:NADH-quinone oxidoreductase subunit C n=1 Tax=Candidatus Methylomirabilis tolerans TaxID=3123416 RepID=A0AAJ1AK93_9BACT|nr:NADH-quinone oxidoreductase subunit C [Candidatus Methylomirabilis sp.]
MRDLNGVARQLRATALKLTDLRMHPPREVRVSVERDEIPAFADYVRDRFHARPELIVAEDTRTEHGTFTLRYLFELERADLFIVASVAVPEDDRRFPSLATRWYLASRFEREIHDLFGLVPTGHPDLRRLPLHQFWPAAYYPLLKDTSAPPAFTDDGTPFPFRRVEGEGIHEITVGPVHAGIIEPGHFRFSVEGETIVNLESRLYFVHKGIERLFETIPLARGVELAERISGDCSVAHALAFCQAIESLAGLQIPPRAAYTRVVLLELERLYNHIADVGAICTDTGFAIAHAHTMRIREDLVRLNARLVGHRLLRGTLIAGGVRHDFTAEQVADTRETVRRAVIDFDEVVEIALKNSLVLDRLHGTGYLSQPTARELQVVGPAARASGIDRDARRDHPFAAYAEMPPHVPVHSEGDVWARLMVRVEESREAAHLIIRALDGLPEGAISAPLQALPAGASGFGLVEGWRGPIWHWLVAGEQNRLTRAKIKDPSFANWPALHYAILKNIVPDFPLVNKSFNLSYAGNDL